MFLFKIDFIEEAGNKEERAVLIYTMIIAVKITEMEQCHYLNSPKNMHVHHGV